MNYLESLIEGMDEFDDEIEGDYEDDEVGAPRGSRSARGARGARGSRSARGARGARANLKEKIKSAILGGGGSPAVGMRPLGLGSDSIVGGTDTSAELEAIVQDPFQVVRPVFVVKYNATWAGGMVTVEDIKVGSKSQLLGNEGGPAEAFTPDAQDVALIGDIAGSGITVKCTFALSAVATAGTAYISGWMFGISLS